MRDRICCECKKECIDDKGETIKGYGLRDKMMIVCYECCAKDDVAFMAEQGKWTGYLTRDDVDGKNWNVSNWPGSLRFEVIDSTNSRTNWGHVRYDVWFWGPDGHKWHGKQIGDWNQLCHCRRTKERRRENWDLYTYDVWGNARDGFEVNNVFRTCSIQLPPDATDNQILRAVQASRCEIDNAISDDRIIYIQAKRNGKPVGELRRRDGEPLETGPVWFVTSRSTAARD